MAQVAFFYVGKKSNTNFNKLGTLFALRFAKALVALSCSGGLFFSCEYLFTI